MLKRVILLNLLAIIFYFSTERLFTVEERRILGYFVIMFCVLSFFIAPSISAKETRDDKEQILDKELEDGEFHNDFRRVGSSDDPRPVKPIDLSGNPIEHARESLDEDLKKIGLEKKD